MSDVTHAKIGFAPVTNGVVLVLTIEGPGTLMCAMSLAHAEALHKQIELVLANPHPRCETVEDFARMATIPTWTSDL